MAVSDISLGLHQASSHGVRQLHHEVRLCSVLCKITNLPSGACKPILGKTVGCPRDGIFLGSAPTMVHSSATFCRALTVTCSVRITNEVIVLVPRAPPPWLDDLGGKALCDDQAHPCPTVAMVLILFPV